MKGDRDVRYYYLVDFIYRKLFQFVLWNPLVHSSVCIGDFVISFADYFLVQRLKQV